MIVNVFAHSALHLLIHYIDGADEGGVDWSMIREAQRSTVVVDLADVCSFPKYAIRPCWNATFLARVVFIAANVILVRRSEQDPGF